MIESLTSPNLPAPHFRYSPLIKAGPFYKTAGMVALDLDSGQLEAGNSESETRKILGNLLAALPDFGLSLDDMVSATIYAVDFSEFPGINTAWEEVFAEGQRPPARTSIGVSDLPLGARVEIEFMFYK